MISLRYLGHGDWMLRHKSVKSAWVNGRERVTTWRVTTSVTETRLTEDDMQDLKREISLALDGPGDTDEGHYSGCVCADCSGAELTADND